MNRLDMFAQGKEGGMGGFSVWNRSNHVDIDVEMMGPFPFLFSHTLC